MSSPPYPSWEPSPSWTPDPNRSDFLESRASTVISVCSVLTFFSFIALSARVYTRVRVVCNFGVDDIIIICAWLLSSTFTALVIIQASRGLGRHAWSLTYDEYSSFSCPFWASTIAYHLAMVSTKVSILLQYLRIFVERKLRIACWAVFGVTIVYGAWAVLVSINLCTPVAYFWDKSIPGGHCLPAVVTRFINAAFNIITDVAILVLPMPAISRLRLPRKNKIALMTLLGLGGVVCVISMLRFRSLYFLSTSPDTSWFNAEVAAWATCEINLGIICACLAPSRPLLGRWIPFLTQSGTEAYGRGSKPLQELNKSSKSRDDHIVLVEATGLKSPLSRNGFASPLKVITEAIGRHDDEKTPNQLEDGRIRATTVIEQEIRDERVSENGSQQNLVHQ